ncbi:hypothetical protein [Nonomuraea wenchangensis]|uniref:hypothetical protein n=1 Tax=Nonomuraea wenchangensis TaxID=568860 RepID=UPI0037AD713B
MYAIVLGLLGNAVLTAAGLRERLSGGFRTEFFIKTGLVLLDASINLKVIVTAAGPTIAQALVLIATTPSGSGRMVDLHAGSTRDLEIHPGLWAGVWLVREGAGTALVGSYAEVAALLRQYAEGGVSEFVLSGWPHLEEAYRVGEYVLPRLAPVPG